MIIQNLKLEQFRNYQNLNLTCSPELNVIHGENAQGKTNLLEAIAYLSTTHSHRTRYDKELINFSAERAYLAATLSTKGRDFLLEAHLARGRRRQLFSNQIRLNNSTELSGILQTILFCPEDLDLIRDGPAARRRFLDSCICQLRPRYTAALIQYQRLYEHKSHILRDSAEKPALLETLDIFNRQLAQTGAILIRYRAYFIQRLREYAATIHQDFSGNKEILTLQYQTVKTIQDPQAPVPDLIRWLEEHQNSHRQAELTTGTCLSGPHKDDLILEINGKSARQFASQGQTRTAALSLKLGARELFFHETGEWPVLLLDDVLSELDRKRQSFILERITGGQVFLTCCDDMELDRLRRGTQFHIRNGAVV